MEDEKIIDVDYENFKEDTTPDVSNNIINGEPLFFSSVQVANIINEDVSTVRYWSKRFDKILNIEVSNKNRRQYKKLDIEKLKFIKKLAREDGLTLAQIEEYATSKGFDIDNIEQSVLDSSNPLAIQTFISAVTMELDKKLNSFAKDLLNKINEQQKINFTIQQEVNEVLRQDIALTVDEIVSEKLDQSLQEFKTTLDTKEQEAAKRDNEMLEYLKHQMEERKKENELQLQQQKKGFFSKLFKK